MGDTTTAPSIHSIATSEPPVDLSTTPRSLAKAVIARRAEFVRPHRVRVKIGSWNVAACPGADKDLASWFVDGQGIEDRLADLDIGGHGAVQRDPEGHHVHLVGGGDVGLYVLGLQEIVDLNMTKDFVGRAVYADGTPTDKWVAALEAALPKGYELVASEQMTGLLMLIYASPEVAATVSNVSTKQVGTGLLGYFGNKGAVTTRIVLGETTRMVFVNSHLASGEGTGAVERRCWDTAQVLSKTQFDPVVSAGVAEDEGDRIGDEDFAFWFGDLNFRLQGLPGDDIRRLLTLHARGEYDVSGKGEPLDGEGVIVMRGSESDDDTATTLSPVQSTNNSFDTETTLPDPDDFPEDPSQDPTSLQATLDSLLPHDQLRLVTAQRKAFHEGWREGPITFLPTYKYDVGTVGLFDTSEKQRAPSWCDRILYRTRTDKQAYEKRVAEEEQSRKKDEEMKSRGIDQDEDVLFSYDPDTDAEPPQADYDYDEYSEDAEDSGGVITKDGYHDHISLDIYTSHQRIMSSDHKPLISIFTLDYDAVVPELKAKVHAEVARELDRAENEGRPAITVVVDSSPDGVVALGELGFMQKKTTSVTIANTGGAAASVCFVDKPGSESGDAHNWLETTLVQDSGLVTDRPVVLSPGDTVTVHITAQVTQSSHLRALNDASTTLDDVLVLRVEDGRDHFLPVRATWLPSSFGRSLDELIRIPDGGIRSFLSAKSIRGAVPYDQDVHCSAPKELFKLTEAVQTLAERCAAEESMLDSVTIPKDAGWPFEAGTIDLPREEQDEIQASIITALDTDAPLLDALPATLPSPHKLELLSSTLLLFLSTLTDGVIPPHLWAKLSAALPTIPPQSAWPDTKTQVLDVLATAGNHNIAFVFLTATLSRVVAELTPLGSEKSGGLARRLSFRRGTGAEGEVMKRRRNRERRYAVVFATVVCRSEAEGSGGKAAKERERVVLEMFVRRDD